jgi:hypothetical protein
MFIAKVVGYADWITAGATAVGLMVTDSGFLDPDGCQKVGPSHC